MHIRVKIEMKCYTKNELWTHDHDMHIVDFIYILLINFFLYGIAV